MNRLAPFVLAILSVLGGPALGQEPIDDSDIASHQASEALAFSLGVQAHLYGYPLVEMLRARDLMTAVDAPDDTGRAPVNRFGHVRRLATPEWADVVTPSIDTLFSSAWLSLEGGPVVLSVPETGGRYYSFTLIDAWSNVFAVISRRTRGEQATKYAIVGPDFTGQIPRTMELIDSPTNTVWVVGRTFVAGETDLQNVRALQDGYRLMPLTTLGEPPRKDAEPERAAEDDTDVPESLEFFHELGRAMRANPPPERDAVLLDRFAEIGLTAERGFACHGIDVPTASGLSRAVPVAEQILAARSKRAGELVNGWRVARSHGKWGGDYLRRAVAAYKGLGAMSAEETVHPIADVDGDGRQLHGAQKYTLTFGKGGLPPVGAFWSLTIYDGATLGLVKNEMGRVKIGDRTLGLEYGEDGALEILIQREAPEGRKTNWLPAPAGEFYLVLRLYEPGRAVLDGTFAIPAVERVD